MAWNLVFSEKLPKEFQPEIFWKDIPAFLKYGENALRVLVLMLTFLMPLSIATLVQKKGVVLYVIGTLIYFASWYILINFPNIGWSQNIIGFTAPAFTPLIWLLGIGLLGNSFYFNLPFKRWYFISISILFLIFHNIHAIIIYTRTH